MMGESQKWSQSVSMDKELIELLETLDALDELLAKLNWVLRGKKGSFAFLRRIRKRLAIILPEENIEAE